MQTIVAEGISWPVETFLDSHRFERCDGTPPEVAELDAPLLCVTRDLAIAEIPARHAPWPDVIAFRAPNLSCKFDECDHCGGVTVVTYRAGSAPGAVIVEEHCSRCDEDADSWVYDADWQMPPPRPRKSGGKVA